VAKLEELLSELEFGVKTLKIALAKVKKYRQSVLKAAVQGDLSKAWREAQGGSLEPAGVLLERVLLERKQKWLLEQQAKGKKNAKYLEPQAPDSSGLRELPEGWVWASVEQLAHYESRAITDGPFGSNLKTEHYTDSGARVVRLQNIASMRFLDEKSYVSENHYKKLINHAVFAGDIVIRSLGEPALVSCIIPANLGNAVVKADCIRLKVFEPHIHTKFVLFALNSTPIQRNAKKSIHGVGRPRLGLNELRVVGIPLPPLEEQAFIVSQVEAKLSATDHLENSIKANLLRAERLRASTLNMAFSGKLVPQDENDEPASVLLERIRALRVAVGGRKKL
jgi:type I restriction enzyme S subunit